MSSVCFNHTPLCPVTKTQHEREKKKKGRKAWKNRLEGKHDQQKKKKKQHEGLWSQELKLEGRESEGAILLLLERKTVQVVTMKLM